MTKAIENIVAGYVTLKNRKALEELANIASGYYMTLGCARAVKLA